MSMDMDTTSAGIVYVCTDPVEVYIFVGVHGSALTRVLLDEGGYPLLQTQYEVDPKEGAAEFAGQDTHEDVEVSLY